MITKTVDSVVREVLLEEGLSMHFYVGVLLQTLSETQRLSMNHGMHVKQQSLTINSYNRTSLPEDMLYLIDISVRKGEKLIPAVRDTGLNRMYRFDEFGAKIAFPDATDGSIPIVYETNDPYAYSSREGFGGFFGLSAPQDRTFNVDYVNSEIVFSNEFTSDEVVITYAADPVTCSTCTLIRYEYVDTLKSYAKMKYHENSGISNQYQIESARRDYQNRKRNMKALVYPTSKADLIYAVRKGLHFGGKK
jgi:hypothetical protein